MSRLEKTLERKSKKKKYRTLSKVIFVFLLAINAMICVCIIDINAKKMLGQDIQIQDAVDNIRLYFENTIENINILSTRVKNQIKQ